MSGHSKWATTKRWKAVVDAKRGNIFTKLARNITVAVRTGGGPDPKSNFKLRLAVDRAREVSMPKDNIERAIKKGSGEGEGLVEEAVYEGYGPSGIALIIETITDNKNRTVNDIKHLLTRWDGSLGASGSTAWMFDRLGVIRLGRPLTDEEALLVIDSGAKDFDQDETGTTVYAAWEDLPTVKEKLTTKGLVVEQAELHYLPKERVFPNDPDKLNKLLEELESLDDVQNVYTNADF